MTQSSDHEERLEHEVCLDEQQAGLHSLQTKVSKRLKEARAELY